MRALTSDLSVFERLTWEQPPVGIKFSFFRPEQIPQLAVEKNLSFCEMLTEAQLSSAPFYFSKENNETCVGRILLGMDEVSPFAESGQIGARLKVFQEPRANFAFYKHIPKMPKGTINYVVFSPLKALTFEPDLLIFTATAAQAEVLMRAMTYSTGELYVSKTTPVIGCAWIYLYPFQSGKVNYILPEMVHGMKGRELYPPGTVLLSIPYQWLPTITQNLGEMTIALSSHGGRDQYLAELGQVFGQLAADSQNP